MAMSAESHPFDSLSAYEPGMVLRALQQISHLFPNFFDLKYFLFCIHVCFKELNPAHNSYTGHETQCAELTRHRERVGLRTWGNAWGCTESKDSGYRGGEGSTGRPACSAVWGWVPAHLLEWRRSGVRGRPCYLVSVT